MERTMKPASLMTSKRVVAFAEYMDTAGYILDIVGPGKIRFRPSGSTPRREPCVISTELLEMILPDAAACSKHLERWRHHNAVVCMFLSDTDAEVTWIDWAMWRAGFFGLSEDDLPDAEVVEESIEVLDTTEVELEIKV